MGKEIRGGNGGGRVCRSDTTSGNDAVCIITRRDGTQNATEVEIEVEENNKKPGDSVRTMKKSNEETKEPGREKTQIKSKPASQ